MTVAFLKYRVETNLLVPPVFNAIAKIKQFVFILKQFFCFKFATPQP
jgi:hypothetical protein